MKKLKIIILICFLMQPFYLNSKGETEEYIAENFFRSEAIPSVLKSMLLALLELLQRSDEDKNLENSFYIKKNELLKIIKQWEKEKTEAEDKINNLKKENKINLDKEIGELKKIILSFDEKISKTKFKLQELKEKFLSEKSNWSWAKKRIFTLAAVGGFSWLFFNKNSKLKI